METERKRSVSKRIYIKAGLSFLCKFYSAKEINAVTIYFISLDSCRKKLCQPEHFSSYAWLCAIEVDMSK